MRPLVCALACGLIGVGLTCAGCASTNQVSSPDSGPMHDDGGVDGAPGDGDAESALLQLCGITEPGGELPPCPEGSYCRAFAGMCSGSGPIPGEFTGHCMPIPDECQGDADEVCGCDGVTYDNECAMDMARAGVQFHDACDSTCTSNPDCGDDELCALDIFAEDSSDACDLSQGGRCVNFSLICKAALQAGTVGDPVCGCDGQTYDTGCDAVMEGRTNVAHDGPCETEDGGM
jgi:hypothetical protein